MQFTNRHGISRFLDNNNVDTIDFIIDTIEMVRELNNYEYVVNTVVSDFVRNCKTLEDADSFAKEIAWYVVEAKSAFYVVSQDDNCFVTHAYDPRDMDEFECWMYDLQSKRFMTRVSKEPLKFCESAELTGTKFV